MSEWVIPLDVPPIPGRSDQAQSEIKQAITIAEDIGARALHILSGCYRV
jgi:hydroxypyruvate isomerase